MKQYKQLTIQTYPPNNETISGLLWQLDLSGIIETDNGLIAYTDGLNKISFEEIKKILESAVEQKIIYKFDIAEEVLEDKNWNEEYEKKVRVIEVTDRIVIKPSFKDYNKKENQIVITIDPKMSFGTGEHETTRLVLMMLEKYVAGNNFVLDVGSGTGVLAIASVLLGAEKAIGIDNDEWCLLNGTENVKANNLIDKVDIRLAELNQIEEKNFDLIVANINKHILLEISELLRNKIKNGGAIILSGLLYTDEPDIVAKYSDIGFKTVDKNQLNEWIVLVLK
ncbi:MAG: 50S ribosomal protein L11 methyltransferase [Bacteroidota bacterium]